METQSSKVDLARAAVNNAESLVINSARNAIARLDAAGKDTSELEVVRSFLVDLAAAKSHLLAVEAAEHKAIIGGRRAV